MLMRKCLLAMLILMLVILKLTLILLYLNASYAVNVSELYPCVIAVLILQLICNICSITANEVFIIGGYCLRLFFWGVWVFVVQNQFFVPLSHNWNGLGCFLFINSHLIWEFTGLLLFSIKWCTPFCILAAISCKYIAREKPSIH